MFALKPLLREILMRPDQAADKVVLGQRQFIAPLAFVGEDGRGEQRVGGLGSDLGLDLALGLDQCVEEGDEFGPGRVGEEVGDVSVRGKGAEEAEHDVHVGKDVFVADAPEREGEGVEGEFLGIFEMGLRAV